jgi:hypothetical protein
MLQSGDDEPLRHFATPLVLPRSNGVVHRSRSPSPTNASLSRSPRVCRASCVVVREELLPDGKERFVLAVQQQTGVQRLLPMEDIIGLSFDVHHEKAREAPLGQLTIVTATSRTPLHHRAAWAAIAALSLALAVLSWLQLGPWSCIVILTCWALDLGRSGRVSAEGSWIVPRVLALLGVTAVYVLANWLPARSSSNSDNSSSSSSSNSVTAAVTLIACVCSPLALWPLSEVKWAYFSPRNQGKELAAGNRSSTSNTSSNSSSVAALARAQWRARLRRVIRWRPPPLPQPVKPIVLRFSQDELSAMFEVQQHSTIPYIRLANELSVGS